MVKGTRTQDVTETCPEHGKIKPTSFSEVPLRGFLNKRTPVPASSHRDDLLVLLLHSKHPDSQKEAAQSLLWFV